MLLIIAGFLGLSSFIFIAGIVINMYNYRKYNAPNYRKYVEKFLYLVIIAQFILALVNILRGESWGMNILASFVGWLFYSYGLDMRMK